MSAAAIVAAAVGIVVGMSISGNLDRAAKALEELARIAGREHGIREQQRAEADLANVRNLEERRR